MKILLALLLLALVAFRRMRKPEQKKYYQFLVNLDALVNTRYYAKTTGELAYLVAPGEDYPLEESIRLWFDEEDVLKLVELAVKYDNAPERATLYINVPETNLIQTRGAIKLHEDFTELYLILENKTLSYPEIFGLLPGDEQ